MNTNGHTSRNRFLRAISTVPGKIATGTAIVGATIGSAMAQTPLGTAAAAAVADVDADVNGVLVVLVVVLMLLVGWGYLKRAK